MVSISPEIIKEIAGQLDSGMKCFYHMPTGSLESYPDDSGGFAGFDEEPFQNFKQLLPEYPELRQQWFDYKNRRYLEWVQEQLDEFNSLNKESEE